MIDPNNPADLTYEPFDPEDSEHEPLWFAKF